jgi:FkbM family methyltransferase
VTRMFLRTVARRCLNAVGVQPLRWEGNLLLTPTKSDALDTDLALGRIALNLHLRGLLRALGINCVFDVGANAGQYALNLRHLDYTGHIVSFEPVPELYEALMRLACGDKYWTVFPYALGAADSEAEFNVTPDTQFSSLLTPNNTAEQLFGGQVSGARKVHVEVRRLDGLLDPLLAHIDQPRIFLKMDTQGNDTAVFEGLGHRAENIAALQSEVSLLPIYESMPSAFDAIPIYMRRGFAVTGMFPVSRDDGGRVIEYDCVMSRVPLNGSRSTSHS